MASACVPGKTRTCISSGVTAQGRPCSMRQEWFRKEGRKEEGEKHDTVRGVFQHPNVLQTPPGPRSVTHKRKPRSGSASPQQKVGFLSKQIRLGSAIKPLATGPCHSIELVKHTKTNRTVFPWISDEKMVGLPGMRSLRNIQQREPLTNCWCAACWEQLL